MAELSIEVAGDEELKEAIKRAAEALGKEAVTQILLEGANIIYDQVKSNVPVGETGRLRLSVVTKKMPIGETLPAVAIGAIDRKIAPHAWLVERGHRTVQGGRLKVSARQRKKGKGAGMITGRVPAHPYWKPNVERAQGAAREHITQRVIESVEGAFNQ